MIPVFFLIPYVGIIFFFAGIIVSWIRSGFNERVDRDLDKFKLRVVTGCNDCWGNGYDRGYQNAVSYNLAFSGNTKCQVCGGSGKGRFYMLDDCNMCHGERVLWSMKRKIICRCVDEKFAKYGEYNDIYNPVPKERKNKQ